jgi:prepilin-type N-terminal cleavage/methylation domain-containing protein
MKTINRSAGFTLIEMMVCALAMTILGAGIWSLIRASYDSQYMLMNQNEANTNARATVDTLADSMRGMQTLTAVAAGDVTYTDNSGASVRYWRNGSDSTLRKTVGGLPNGGTQILNGVSSLTFNFWSYSGGAWASSSAPNPLSNVGAADITVNGNFGGYGRQIFSSVKLRQKRFDNTNGF